MKSVGLINNSVRRMVNDHINQRGRRDHHGHSSGTAGQLLDKDLTLKTARSGVSQGPPIPRRHVPGGGRRAGHSDRRTSAQSSVLEKIDETSRKGTPDGAHGRMAEKKALKQGVGCRCEIVSQTPVRGDAESGDLTESAGQQGRRWLQQLRQDRGRDDCLY